MKAHIRPQLPCALLWNFDHDQPGRSALETTCQKLGLKLIETSVSDLGRPVGEICGLVGKYRSGPLPPVTDFPAALILQGLSDTQLDTLLADLRAAQAVIPLKAVVTETNRQWPLAILLQELMEERAAFESAK